MHCPFCRHTDSRVIDSRTTDDGAAIRRRRQCPECNRRFTTLETSSLSVIKRSGASEPFSRAKVLSGVRKACQGRPVTEDDLALLAQRVEETIRALGNAEIEAHEVGMAVLEPLRELDEVAYLRFASVYQGWESLEDFEGAIALLRAERDAAGGGALGSEPARRAAVARGADGSTRTTTLHEHTRRTAKGTVRPRRDTGIDETSTKPIGPREGSTTVREAARHDGDR